MVQLITVTEKGLKRGIDRFRDQRQILQNPDMSWGVRNVAREWNKNFTSEGGRVGGWRRLSSATNALRVARGYPPDHPILRQSGTLHRVAIRSLIDARGPKGSVGSGVRMQFNAPSPGRAFLRLTGEKVKNQFGQRGKGLPARKFWFVDDGVVRAAADGIERWYKQELGRVR